MPEEHCDLKIVLHFKEGDMCMTNLPMEGW
jgi:hypothetical protein